MTYWVQQMKSQQTRNIFSINIKFQGLLAKSETKINSDTLSDNYPLEWAHTDVFL